MDYYAHGPIFPATIACIERFAPGLSAADGAKPIVTWSLTLDGRSREFPTYDMADTRARELLRSPAQRDAWREGRDA